MNKKTLKIYLLCAGLTLLLTGSALNPLSCIIPQGGGGQIGGGFVDGQEGTVAPTAPENTNRNVVTATVTMPDNTTVTISTIGVVSTNGRTIRAHDDTVNVDSAILLQLINNIWNFGGPDNPDTTYLGNESHPVGYIKFIDSTTTPVTHYVTYEDTTTYTETGNNDGCSGILNLFSDPSVDDYIFAAFSFTASDDTTTPKVGIKVVVEGTAYIPKPR